MAAALEASGVTSTFTAAMIPAARKESADAHDLILAGTAHHGLRHEEFVVETFADGLIPVSVFTPPGDVRPRPVIFYVHGGGMVSGDRFSGMEFLAPWSVEHDAVIVAADYRLAPEFPDPYPVEDTYAALCWTYDNANELGVDPARIAIVGVSAGGGIAAGVTLLARDRGRPPILAQMLLCPMLDDRDQTLSATQIDGVGFWDRESNRTGWAALLGERRGTDDVSIYAAPARANDLSALPQTFIDVGSAEVFRDEAVAYASALWAAGGSADLHVWAGGVHAYEMFAPDAAISRGTVSVRNEWLRSVLA
ncbi:alpha/beta hydrolase [Microbacterium sp. Root180]|uniref:alpha/beta hydrolase n=1 Tax=Microbacterium sp. Root180 TaxID=1736483 RepID=UPI001F20AF3B|nr:alpha/beta hydrolase [Microbacterium sp. Root180]